MQITDVYSPPSPAIGVVFIQAGRVPTAFPAVDVFSDMTARAAHLSGASAMPGSRVWKADTNLYYKLDTALGNARTVFTSSLRY